MDLGVVSKVEGTEEPNLNGTRTAKEGEVGAEVERCVESFPIKNVNFN